MKIRKAHHVVFAWYGILAVFLFYSMLNKNEPVSPSLDFLYFSLPMMAVPVFIAITGVIDRIRQKQWLYTLIHVVLVAVIIGILKQIAS